MTAELFELFTLSSCLNHSPSGLDGPHPSDGSVAQLPGSAECNDCMQTPGVCVSTKLTLTLCVLLERLALWLIANNGYFHKSSLMDLNTRAPAE